MYIVTTAQKVNRKNKKRGKNGLFAHIADNFCVISHVKAKQDHIPVFDNIIFPFQSGFSGGF